MVTNRTKNATRNIYWGLMNKSLEVLLPFAVRTVFIKVFGVEYLGLNSLFTSILSVLSLAELGLGSAIVFSMYEPIANDDDETVCALLALYKKIYHIIGIIILVTGLILTPFITYLIDGDYPKEINIYAIFLIQIFNTVISYFLFAYKSALFAAYQRNDLQSKVLSLINILSCGLKILVLLTIKNYYVYVLILPAISIIGNISRAYIASKSFPSIKCYGVVSDELKKQVKKRVVGLLSFKLYSVIFYSVDTIVISRYLGLAQLGVYNNYYYIQNSIIAFLGVFTTSITAGIGNKMVTNSNEDNYKDLHHLLFMNGWLTGWCAVSLLCLYQPFITIWVGEQYLFPISTMVLMVIYFYLPRVSTLTYSYREAAGLWYEDRIRPLVAAIVNLAVNIILVKAIGINGVLISTLLCSIFINIPWGTHILFKHYFKRSEMEYFAKMALYIVGTCFVGIVTYMISGLVNLTGILGLSIKLLICVVVPNVLFIIMYCRNKEFKFLKDLVYRVLKLKGRR